MYVVVGRLTFHCSANFDHTSFGCDLTGIAVEVAQGRTPPPKEGPLRTPGPFFPWPSASRFGEWDAEDFRRPPAFLDPWSPEHALPGHAKAPGASWPPAIAMVPPTPSGDRPCPMGRAGPRLLRALHLVRSPARARARDSLDWLPALVDA